MTTTSQTYKATLDKTRQCHAMQHTATACARMPVRASARVSTGTRARVFHVCICLVISQELHSMIYYLCLTWCVFRFMIFIVYINNHYLLFLLYTRLATSCTHLAAGRLAPLHRHAALRVPDAEEALLCAQRERSQKKNANNHMTN